MDGNISLNFNLSLILLYSYCGELIVKVSLLRKSAGKMQWIFILVALLNLIVEFIHMKECLSFDEKIRQMSSSGIVAPTGGKCKQFYGKTK